MELTRLAKKKLSEEVRMKICLDEGVSFSTFDRWVKTNHKNLTLLSTVSAIKRHTGLSLNEIFTDEKIIIPVK